MIIYSAHTSFNHAATILGRSVNEFNHKVFLTHSPWGSGNGKLYNRPP